MREDPQSHSKQVQRSLEQLRGKADEALERGPYSVVHKRLTPPSGDKHDYMSYSRYWWPNPDTEDGLPYVRRDGEVNRRLLAQGDRERIGAFYDDLESLALAGYLFDEREYSDHGALLVRTWFVNPETRMNPNINFGQAVPGRATGRGVGIIDARHFIRVMDSIALLDEVHALASEDLAAVKTWFGDYLGWLLTSERGEEERSAENNHGAWYAAQTSHVALFVGREDVAKQVINEVRNERIGHSILTDGSQPEELVRTRSLHYSLFSLSALSVVARMGEHVGIDVWNYQAPSGASLRRAFLFIAPHLADHSGWKFEESEDFRLSDRQALTLRIAAARLKSRECALALENAASRYNKRYYTPLLFTSTEVEETRKAAPTVREPRVLMSEMIGDYTVSVINDFEPTPLAISLPDTSDYTAEKVRSRARRKFTNRQQAGSTVIRPIREIELFEEATRGDRGDDLRQRQAGDELQAIVIEQGVVTLGELAKQFASSNVIEASDEAVIIRLPLLVAPGATLIMHGRETPVVRFSTDRGAFLSNLGELYLLDAEISAWSEASGEPTRFDKKMRFRPFISAYIRSKTYVAGCHLHDLGFAGTSAYGFTLTSHPERERGEATDDWPTGVLVGNKFSRLYYGFYSFEARDVAIVANEYIDCIKYGIDPHDRSTRLIIAGNTTRGTVERHGIIGSRGVSHSYIFGNKSYDNGGSGIMLDRQCTHNVVTGNRVYRNGQGVAIYESPRNIVANNLIAFNTKSGVRVRNSTDIQVRGNTVVCHDDYALEAYAKRLDDHDERLERGDTYEVGSAVDFFGNRLQGNKGVAKASELGQLRFFALNRDVKIEPIARRLQLKDEDWSTEEKLYFGSELKPLTETLREAFARPAALIEIKGQD